MHRLLAPGALLVVAGVLLARGQARPGAPAATSFAALVADSDEEKLAKQRCPKPRHFALVFSFGYAGDLMPKEDDRFDRLLGKITDAGFNTIHCTYTPKRLDLCKKHGVQMMVDLLADEHHVYKSPEKAKAVCEKLRGDPAVWGYNVWNDPYRKTTPGRVRDVNNVRAWDPTHPAYTGTYRTDGMRGLTNPDVFGYYDFHWKRGIDQHFPHLLAYKAWAKERDAWFYGWLGATPGQPGKGNYNRALWSANTAISCGQKGILWFLATELMDRKTLEWTDAGKDIARVNRAIAPLGDELVRLGLPAAVYSTPVTRTAGNDPLPDGKKSRMPPGLEKHAVPADFWLQAQSGEFVMGVFAGGGAGEAVFLANHNTYAEQNAALKLSRPLKARLFNRATGKWGPLEARDGVVKVLLAPGGGELLRFEK